MIDEAMRVQAHSNESVGSLRHRIASHMKHPVEQIQFVPNEKVVRVAL